MEQSSLDTSKGDEYVEVVEATLVNEKSLTDGGHVLTADFTTDRNAKWMQVTYYDTQRRINADSVAVVSGCCLQNGRPTYNGVTFFTSTVVPRNGGFLDIRVGIDTWKNKPARLNIIIYF